MLNFLRMIPTKLIGVLAGVALVAALGYGFKQVWDAKENAEAQLQATQIDLDQTRSDLAQERRNQQALTDALARAEQRSRERVEANTTQREALRDEFEANPEWSRTPVPDSVRDRLCQRLDCTGTQD